MAATHHELAASPATCHWGSFDARLAPVLSIEAGDRVTVHTVSGAPDVLPGPGFAVPPEHALIHDRLRPEPGPHILTGPIRIEGARPRRRAGGPDPRGRAAPGLGLDPRATAVGHLARGLPRGAADAHRARSGARRRPAALGHRAAAAAVLRRHGRRAARRLGPDQQRPAARAWRQPRQQGAGRRHDALSAGLCTRAPCSRPATATPCRATARSASPRSRPR